MIGSVRTSSLANVKYQKIIHEVSESVVYVGSSLPGTNEADSFWQIIKIEKSGSFTSVKYAQGSSNFLFTWNLRLTYTY